MLELFRGAEALTRAEVMARSGLSRSTVNQRIDALLQVGLIAPAGEQLQPRGRPAERFAFNRGRGVLLVADMGATGMRTGVCDLAGKVLGERDCRIDLRLGPEALLATIDSEFDALLTAVGVEISAVMGVGLDVPGPVDFARGQVVSPPIMSGWDRFDIRGWFGRRFTCPILVENDVNAMAFGEQRIVYPDVTELLMLKIGTGVGAGLVTQAGIFRGADGAAGDIGHLHATNPSGDASPEPACRCGRSGCVEAYAGGWALVRDLKTAGLDVEGVDDVVQLIRRGDLSAVNLMRQAARIIGEAIAQAVSLVNPSVIILAGQLSGAEEQLLAGVREVVYQRSLSLATQNLRIARSKLDQRAGLIGLALLLADTLFAAPGVDQFVDLSLTAGR
ncbi:ROK family transcriptional regulator [Nocardioides sp. KR10-350]|uniref:ROK family transcriptional regulator n=1 Tax=Nocardioides cheoyonin TaxID=3156615 RepID=UPI0032B389E2